MEKLTQHIEALIFATEGPISQEEIQLCLEETFESSIPASEIATAVEVLKEKYRGDDFAFEITEIAGGLRFLTKGAYYSSVTTYLKQTTKKRLSKAALETLAIIAYKQPVTKTELENIRGVSCDYTLQKLLEKELVTIAGRSEGPGRPLLYNTSDKFMDYFGIKSLQDLPKPKDFQEPESSVGEQAPIEEASENSELNEANDG